MSRWPVWCWGPLLLSSASLLAQNSGSVPVSAQANIFGAGLASPPGGPLPGIVPPFISFQAGPNQTITFPSVSGLVSFDSGRDYNGGDGTVDFTTGTNFNAQGGISGLIDDPGRYFFLVGVFLTSSPAPLPAPAPMMNFSGHENFTELSPDIGQTFFIGDGLTGTATGQPQKFHIPATATRLFLGFADGANFHGDPKFYGDNVGTLTVQYNISSGCQVNVTPQWLQSQTPWGMETYDHTLQPMATLGCAVTSLAMALKFAGVTTLPSFTSGMSTIDPGVLNENMILYGGFAFDPSDPDSFGGALFKDTTHRISNDNLKFVDLGMGVNGWDSLVNPTEAYRFLDDNLCSDKPHPVIVRVRSPVSRVYPRHFVLVTGKQLVPNTSPAEFRYTIADPAGLGTTLDHYPDPTFGILPEFRIRGVVKDPPGDLSELDFAVGNSANLLVIDPAGLRTGFDPTTNQEVQSISNSSFFSDAIDSHTLGKADTGITRSVGISQPLQGVFGVIVTGIKLGTYTLEVDAFSKDGTAQAPIRVRGIAAPGSASGYQIQFGSAIGNALSVTVLANFQTTLADINNSLQLGLIDNRGIANSLLQKIQAAQNATGLTRSNILNAFKNEVDAQAGKHIIGLSPQLLLQDADSLISQNR